MDGSWELVDSLFAAIHRGLLCDGVQKAKATETGAGVILCTVATNLKDSAPFAAAHRGDLSESEQATWKTIYSAGIAYAEDGKHAQAAERFAQAARIDDGHADLHFRLGHRRRIGVSSCLH